MRERASIIIPTYNGLDRLQRCVESIRTHTPKIPYELIVADNASDDGTLEWCMEQRIASVSLPRNEGSPAACNQGLRIAAGGILVLLHHDTVVTPDWLDNLSTALNSAPDIGIVGPVMNEASGGQMVNYPFEDLDEFQRIAREVNVSDLDKWKEAKRIDGICFVFRRGLMERIGLLEESFGSGHEENAGYCSRAKEKGYRMLICHDALIYHEGRD